MSNTTTTKKGRAKVQDTAKDTAKVQDTAKDTAKVQDTAKDTAKVQDTAKDTAKVQDTAKVNAFISALISYKVQGDTIPNYTYTDLEDVIHGKRTIKTGVFECTHNNKSVHIATNFDAFLERLPVKAAYKSAKENGKITLIAKGTGYSTFKGEQNYTARAKENGGYSTGDIIDSNKYKEFTASLLVYCKAVYIETENDVYIYILRNKGELSYNRTDGFKVG